MTYLIPRQVGLHVHAVVVNSKDGNTEGEVIAWLAGFGGVIEHFILWTTLVYHHTEASDVLLWLCRKQITGSVQYFVLAMLWIAELLFWGSRLEVREEGVACGAGGGGKVVRCCLCFRL